MKLLEYYLYNGQFYSSDELCHYGIKGMKWGVRRYQNKDGSLTPAGKKHRELLSGKISADECLEAMQEEMQSGKKGPLYEYAKAQKAYWDAEKSDDVNRIGATNRTTKVKNAIKDLEEAYKSLKLEYLSRSASEEALQFLKENPEILINISALMETDVSDPRQGEYVDCETGFESALDILYETDEFYEYIKNT